MLQMWNDKKLEGMRRTFADFYALHRLVVHCPGPLLDQFVALDTNVKDLRPLDGELNELFHHIVDDVSRSLHRTIASGQQHDSFEKMDEK